MPDHLHYFFFGLYPYIALAVFLFGSLARFEREQYTWKSDSSQLLKRGALRWGSNLFHFGIISLFFTHLVGLLTPPAVYHAMGVSTEAKQAMAVIVGAVLGLICMAGLLILIYRRISEPRLYATSRFSDWLTLFWILIVLSLGLLSILTSAKHEDGALMLLLGEWAQRIVTFRSGAADIMMGVPWVFQWHMVLGMTLFLIFPFTRLVHVWSGFASVGYLGRAWQLVRSR
ncbi:respiratory nitrate reductase subunit gamma [Bordetella petrii]|uniref:respiratory nitrate reductase subunit gamma n=1 Tax=Bordetella petrii TaxID=94624 RepID=UPI001E2A5F11|nr:respiratory nitrate reductase subunit gamma [Bordetella petrii]MCD0503881.1 respiratory nitrate reductase subunit gamma [Bordetella petrii]